MRDESKDVIRVPEAAAEALSRLRNAGYAAFAVGGCVRDSLLGRVPNDWDITTSARPEEVARVFAGFRVIETGVRHGTLTVLLGGQALEITTFRNDGVYLDNRHPLSVTFSDRVEDDLSRRDFTVNAMAYSEEAGIVDLFGGRRDLSERVIRCVGDASTRFHEDGLRILRAIRFASVLDFTLEAETARAVHECRGLLSNIAMERIREEFIKLLCGVGAVRILREYPDVIGEFLPEILPCVGFLQNTKYHCFDVWEHTLASLAEAPSDAVVRLAVFLHDVGKPCCYTEDAAGGHFKGHGEISCQIAADVMKRLKFDNATAEEVVLLVEYHDRAIPADVRSVRRLLCKMPYETVFRLMEVQRCDRLAHAPGYRDLSPALTEIPRLVREIRERDECLSLKTMKLSGDDLLALGVPRGKRVGEILNALLERVIDGELPNDHDALLLAARGMI